LTLQKSPWLARQARFVLAARPLQLYFVTVTPVPRRLLTRFSSAIKCRGELMDGCSLQMFQPFRQPDKMVAAVRISDAIRSAASSPRNRATSPHLAVDSDTVPSDRSAMRLGAMDRDLQISQQRGRDGPEGLAKHSISQDCFLTIFVLPSTNPPLRNPKPATAVRETVRLARCPL
jgi:hypothetical protein